MNACNSLSDSDFSVEGKLSNLSTSRLLAIKEYLHDSLSIDTIQVNNKGEFTYKGKTNQPIIVSLFSDRENQPITFFLEKNYSVKIKGDVTLGDLAEIRGGNVNNHLQDFRTANDNLLLTKYRILGKKENMDPAELKNINLQLAKNARKYAEENPDQIASVILLNQYSKNYTSPENLGKDIQSLRGKAAEFYEVSHLKEYYDRVKLSAVGAVAPDIALRSCTGKMVRLTDFKGKPVLLIFDLKNAPLNTKYFEALKDAQKKLKNKVNFISIIIDEDYRYPDSKTTELAKNLDWPILIDGRKWSSKEVKKYNIKIAPSMILISSSGTIEERDISLDSLLAKFTK